MEKQEGYTEKSRKQLPALTQLRGRDESQSHSKVSLVALGIRD
jgi:hypothetical protein